VRERERRGDLVERTDALLPCVGLEVAEDHLLDEQPRLRRPTRRPRWRLRRGDLHGHLSIGKCSSKRGTASAAAPPRRGRGHQPDTPPLSLAEHRNGIEAARRAQGGCGGTGKVEATARERGFGYLGQVLEGKLKRCEGFVLALRNSEVFQAKKKKDEMLGCLSDSRPVRKLLQTARRSGAVHSKKKGAEWGRTKITPRSSWQEELG